MEIRIRALADTEVGLVVVPSGDALCRR